MTRVSTRSLYFFSYLINGISCAAIYFQTSIYAILPLSSTFGIILTSLTTLPYQMVSEFHKDKSFKKKSPPGTQRGFGVDCSLVGSIFFLGQTLISSFMSLAVSKFGNYTTVLLGSVFSLLGCLWISLFVIFPKPRAKKKSNNTH
jgi:solute carrier family 45 protein 1/2/4